VRTADRPAAGRGAAIGVMALVAALLPWLAAWVLPPFAQPQAYHDFADRRALLGIPNALNVLSNVPFLVIGVIGLRALPASMTFLPDAGAARLPWGVLFAGVALTAIGSSVYHLAPTDATLVWDRLPMALGFAGMVAGTLADRTRPRWTVPLLIMLGASGVCTVPYWAASGNLVPYLGMQLGFISVALLATAAIRSPYTRAGWLYGMTALYALALVSERFDDPIDALLGGAVSGHSLKHLLAAAAILVLYWMLRRRRAAA